MSGTEIEVRQEQSLEGNDAAPTIEVRPEVIEVLPQGERARAPTTRELVTAALALLQDGLRLALDLTTRDSATPRNQINVPVGSGQHRRGRQRRRRGRCRRE